MGDRPQHEDTTLCSQTQGCERRTEGHVVKVPCGKDLGRGARQPGPVGMDKDEHATLRSLDRILGPLQGPRGAEEAPPSPAERRKAEETPRGLGFSGQACGNAAGGFGVSGRGPVPGPSWAASPVVNPQRGPAGASGSETRGHITSSPALHHSGSPSLRRGPDPALPSFTLQLLSKRRPEEASTRRGHWVRSPGQWEGIWTGGSRQGVCLSWGAFSSPPGGSLRSPFRAVLTGSSRGRHGPTLAGRFLLPFGVPVSAPRD